MTQTIHVLHDLLRSGHLPLVGTTTFSDPSPLWFCEQANTEIAVKVSGHPQQHNDADAMHLDAMLSVELSTDLSREFAINIFVADKVALSQIYSDDGMFCMS